MLAVMAAVATLALVALMAGEWLARRRGMLDFPLYVADPHAGYRMRAQQRGQFLCRLAWAYDTNGMRAATTPEMADATLLVGDSVVDGGNWIGQEQTLAARIAALTGEQVYPVACRGWALANELAALEQLDDWRRARRLVMVLNPSDFDTIGVMDDPFAFPTSRPRWALPYLVSKRLGHRGTGARPSPNLRETNLVRFRTLVESYSGSIAIVRYPLKGEAASPDPFYRQLVTARAGIALVDLMASSEWGPHCYVDHIHPNGQGVEIMARIIAQEAF